MVNFNNTDTFTAQPGNILQITILEKWNNCLEIFEEYYKKKHNGQHYAQEPLIKGRVYCLFLSIYRGLLKDNKEETEAKFKQLRNTIKFDEVEDIFLWLSQWLYNKKLIMLDSLNKAPKTAEAHNLYHGH